MADQLTIYNRADIVNFMNTGTAGNPVYTRMQGFTEGGKSLNSTTYERRYIDEKTQRSTVTGYSTSIAYNFDRIVENDIHTTLAEIHDKEIVGATVDILTVNMKDNSARLRTYSVIPDTDGGSTDAYTYTGTFHADGDITIGTATVASNGLTASFSATPSLQ